MIISAGLICGASPQKPTRPLSPIEIIQLLESGVTSARVEELAKQYGITFEPTADIEAQLREAGASEELLRTLRELKPKVPEIDKTKPAAVEMGVLVIEATPGGCAGLY